MSLCKCKIDRKVKEECGVFAITRTGDSPIDLAGEIYYALYALQHRLLNICAILVPT